MDPQATYDRIADHFSKTREYAWPEVESFLADRSGGVGLDVGCGNGRHTELLADRTEATIGLDVSRQLLAVADDRTRDRGFAAGTSFLHGDAASLPIRDDSVDLAVYVATIHHLRTRADRLASLDELARVLRPGSVGLVSTWSTAHDRFDEPDKEDSTGDSGEDGSFATTIDWTLPGGETVPRYYYIYSPTAFERLLSDSDLEVISIEISSGNCYAVVATSISP